MHTQTFEEHHRTALIDFLISVHSKFKLLPETLFLAVNLIDRYLSLQKIAENELHVLGLASLSISSKYEEIYPPTEWPCDKK